MKPTAPREAEPAVLPVSGVLAALGEALARHRRAVLVAPPGSGKTTLVPPWLLASGLVPKGEILMLQPRRVAARSVARFIAAQRHEDVGRTVGYQVRFETRASAETRIRVVTEGILTRRLQGDPSLEGVGAVILDEFHERSVHADLALALLKEVQEALRDDLLVLVMSATLDAEPVARFLGHCPIIVAEGRVHPIETHFADEGIDAGARPHEIEAHMARATLDLVDRVEAAHREFPRHRDVLGFLPGVRLIDQTRALLAPQLERRGWDVAVLHGSLDPREQDRALVPGPRPRVVLATNIAETSLTIPGVGAVVDSGLAKVMRYDLAVGSERLETTRIGRASADQRRGRSGRLGPGIAMRLWTRFEDDRLRPFEVPEIRRIDLARVILELYAWGSDPHRFGWFEAPDARAIEDAERRLFGLGALAWKHATRVLTPLGRTLVEVAASPRIAAFLHAAAREVPGSLGLASRWAAVLDEGDRKSVV